MKRLIVVAEDSLIVEAIKLGVGMSGEFELLGQVNGRSATGQAVADASPDVVLIDELADPETTLARIREIRTAVPSAAVFALTLSPSTAWLDALFGAGAAGVVSKATPPGALTTLIRETLEGRVLSLHKPAGAHSSADSSTVRSGLLSARELEVLRLVAAGSTNGEIAGKLWITEQTVKFHLSNIYRKLDVGNRTEASRYAHLNGLVGPEPQPES